MCLLQNNSITSITNVINLKFKQDYWSHYPLHYPDTQSLLPSPLKPQLFQIPIKSIKITHTNLYNLLSVARYISSKYGAVIFFIYIISVKWVIILLYLSIYFLYELIASVPFFTQVHVRNL